MVSAVPRPLSASVILPGENGHEAALHFIDQNTVVYTSDGGRTWLSSATKFPAMIDDSSLPARDRGYVVGEHGMVDRYRIVPANFNAREFFRRPQSSEVPGSNARRSPAIRRAWNR